MSTLSPRRVSYKPAGYRDAVCRGCSDALSVPTGATEFICPKCQRGQVIADIHRMLADVNDLRNGTGCFDGLTIEERDEQLAALGLPTINSKPRFPGFAAMPDDALIEIVAGNAWFNPGEKYDAIAEATIELAKRLDNSTPTPNEQQHIERTSVVVAGEPDAERWDGLA